MEKKNHIALDQDILGACYSMSLGHGRSVFEIVTNPVLLCQVSFTYLSHPCFMSVEDFCRAAMGIYIFTTHPTHLIRLPKIFVDL